MRNLILRILKKAVRLIQKKELPNTVVDEIILKNVFKSNYEKRVLISYLKQPFLEGIKYHHTNYLECYTAAEIFHELGYQVDVIDLMENDQYFNYSCYAVVYGLGFPLENAFKYLNTEKVIKIFYSTGYNPFYSYNASLIQVHKFYLKNKILMQNSSRVQSLFWANQYILSDTIIALGNDLVSKSYIETNSLINVKSVPAFYFDIFDINLTKKDFEISKKQFLWFGSSGLLHKGLDLLINIFKDREDICLHICGGDKSESKFWNFYNPIIDNCDNIFDYGFVDINSEKFKELMNLCAFCIFPSVSEGGSPALLNVMANGALIPVASNTCGVDIADIGYVFDNFEEYDIKQEINKVLLLSSKELLEKSKIVKEKVKSKYSYQIYKSNLKKIVSDAITTIKKD